ncbi:hypothetical protein [Nocardia sp. alder85J]|uniref:hypothetical protein n=1 Tax=Nocardia sp. alder85J TaxID=2862949 RepID=UPI001CD794C1|nr:hypothetical protein [Nocardia sp. alder85J]MCX4096883.1 hypothetical protein [Nocardia sp. alder85J]
MQFNRQEVVDHIRSENGPDVATKAAQMLPDHVDHEHHGEMLQKLGVDPKKMVEKIGYPL